MTARKHANTEMQALPAKINAFVEKFHALGGLPVYIRAMTDTASRSETQRWLDEIRGVHFPVDVGDGPTTFAASRCLKTR